MMPKKTFAASWAAAVLVAAAGCTPTITTESGRALAQPSEQVGLRPVQIFITLGNPTDFDGNGYPHTILAVYLFPDQRQSQLPVWADGSFRFELRLPSGELIERWILPPEIVEQSRKKFAPGPGFLFFLRLAPGDDAIPQTIANLRGSFSGEAGVEIVGDVMSFRIGGNRP